VGSEKTALEAVVAADVELMALREEEAEINRRAWNNAVLYLLGWRQWWPPMRTDGAAGGGGRDQQVCCVYGACRLLCSGCRMLQLFGAWSA